MEEIVLLGQSGFFSHMLSMATFLSAWLGKRCPPHRCGWMAVNYHAAHCGYDMGLFSSWKSPWCPLEHWLTSFCRLPPLKTSIVRTKLSLGYTFGRLPINQGSHYAFLAIGQGDSQCSGKHSWAASCRDRRGKAVEGRALRLSESLNTWQFYVFRAREISFRISVDFNLHHPPLPSPFLEVGPNPAEAKAVY